VAAAVAGCTVVGLLVLGATSPEALTVAAAAGCWTSWWGPGSRRVRSALGRAAVVATRHPAPGWVVVGGLALTVALVWLATVGGEVTWAPASGPPWEAFEDALRATFPLGL
jgi:hypothetical protein